VIWEIARIRITKMITFCPDDAHTVVYHCPDQLLHQPEPPKVTYWPSAASAYIHSLRNRMRKKNEMLALLLENFENPKVYVEI